ncbi:protein-tyrosine phosphatase domain-containing protein [Ditylenchus destructor]|uniref:Protein-tyrosine phosphatase domain-containing protein n=1 Tax=Ditylenchus destructor TaxID=166010 RepID=A0AAD4ND47_9BILA|nr:protein-tyrosine phosphatase domain-containing protein [Ditylenchus destructor]
MAKYVHDLPNDGQEMTVDAFVRNFCSKDVFQKFTDFSHVILKSAELEFEAFRKNSESNRFLDVPCFDSTRVIVNHPLENHDYIHANYVDGFREHHKFILTQAPLNYTIGHFWEMVWQEKCALIVSMVPIDGTKCPAYIPTNAGQKVSFHAFSIQHMGTRTVRKAYDATMLTVQKNDESARKILHLVFYRWPEKGTPTHVTEVLNFIDDMNYNRELILAEAIKDGWIDVNCRTPIVLHGSAGVGRCGSLVVIDICQRKMDASVSHPSGPFLDVEKTMLDVRNQRAMAVQKPEQYLFIHMSLIEYALRKRYITSIDEVDMINYTQEKGKQQET